MISYILVILIILLIILNKRDNFQDNNQQYLFDLSKESALAKFNKVEAKQICVGNICLQEEDLDKLQQLVEESNPENLTLSATTFQNISHHYSDKFVIQKDIFRLQKNNLIAETHVTKNYRLTMEIMPTKMEVHSNIIHFTTGANSGPYNQINKARAIMIGLNAYSYDLYVIVGNTDDPNWQECDESSGKLTLTPNEWNTFKLEVIDNNVKLYLNGTLRCDKKLIGTTLDHPNMQIYLSDPWYLPSKGFVRNVVYERNAK